MVPQHLHFTLGSVSDILFFHSAAALQKNECKCKSSEGKNFPCTCSISDCACSHCLSHDMTANFVPSPFGPAKRFGRLETWVTSNFANATWVETFPG